MVEVRNLQDLCWKKQKGINHKRNQSVDGRTGLRLKWVLKQQGVAV
jgi:hypothetical protein